MLRRVSPANWTLLLGALLGALATVLTATASRPALLNEHLPVPAVAAGVGITFFVAEQFLMNIEFRRQAHSLTLAGVPLLVGALVLPPLVFVLTRVGASLLAFLVQRIIAQKTFYNTAAYGFEAALDVTLLHLVLGSTAHLHAWTGIAAVLVLAAVDQLMCLFVLVVIRLHNGPLRRRDVAGVLAPAAVLSVIASTFGFAAVLLIRDGIFGLVLVVVLAAVGTLGYLGHATTRRQHQSLALVHEFVTGGVGAQTIEVLAEQLLCRIRRLLRAGNVEVTLLEPAADGRVAATWPPALVLSVDEDDRLTVARRDVDPSDWVMVRALTDEEPMLAARTTKDPALRRWLAARGLRDAMLVALPESSGVVGAISATDRLGEIASFTADDLTLLHTLTGHLAVAIRNTRLVEKLGYDATHDALTGLANRIYLADRIAAVLAEPDAAAAVLMLDLDRFKEVNDVLGHDVGDRLLIVVADRLRECVPEGATVARLGGDEFAILLPHHAGCSAEIVRFAERLAQRLADPVTFDEAMLTPEVSIGVALSTLTEPQAELLRQADTAMYEAKTNDVRVAVYDLEMDRGRIERLALLADLRIALSQHPEQFTLDFQPKMDLLNRKITGCEALVRWSHPARGTIAPDQFVPLAETTGLIAVLTPLVLEAALRECATWARDGIDLTVAVNLSARNVSDPGLPARVADALRRHGVPAGKLILEITESSVMGDPEQTLPILHQLTALGVCLSLDDFGTGYSSLSYLQRLPVGEVKIDRSFVLGLFGENAANSRALISSIASLGTNLGLRIVAEGIEDSTTLAELRKLGCQVGQGYGIARPMPAGDLARWLAYHEPRGGLSLVTARA